MDDDPKHVHAGATVFSNFVRDSVSEWGMKQALFGEIEKNISGQFGLRAKRVKPTPNFEKAEVGS